MCIKMIRRTHKTLMTRSQTTTASWRSMVKNLTLICGPKQGNQEPSFMERYRNPIRANSNQLKHIQISSREASNQLNRASINQLSSQPKGDSTISMTTSGSNVANFMQEKARRQYKSCSECGDTAVTLDHNAMYCSSCHQLYRTFRGRYKGCPDCSSDQVKLNGIAIYCYDCDRLLMRRTYEKKSEDSSSA